MGDRMKTKRHSKILELINKYDIETQEELAVYLQKAGINVTQATVSRDIKDLNLSKVPTEKGKQKYVFLKDENTTKDKFVRILKDGVLSMDVAQNILVVRTVSGLAMAVAAAIDALDFYEIVGCIAGDDTVMCVARSGDDAEIVVGKIQKMLEQL
jgi:transcriptional regulator of arginine metabolism